MMVREMKDSGIEWIWEIPKDWDVDRIKYHLKRKEPRNHGDTMVLSVYREYGVIPKDSRNDNHNVTSEDTSKYKYVKKGNLVINKMKAWQGSLAVSEYEGIVSPAYFVFEFTDDKLDKKYFHYLIRGCYKDEFRRLSSGIREGQWDLSPDEFVKTLILIPSIKEQGRIADYLDKKCKEIDFLSSDIQSQINILEDYKRSVITETVTKGLNPDVEMKDSGIEWIGMIPFDWRITRFKYVGTVKSNLVNVGLYQDYPQISPDNIAKDSGILLGYNTVEESGVISDNHLFYKGQLLYSKIRPKLNKAIIAPFDGLCSADMYPIETNECSKFILYMVLSQYFLKQVVLVTEDRVKMPKINQEELGRIYVVLPPMERQEEIVNYLDFKCSEISGAIEDKQKQLDILEQYKKSLIYEYVTGKREVV